MIRSGSRPVDRYRSCQPAHKQPILRRPGHAGQQMLAHGAETGQRQVPAQQIQHGRQRVRLLYMRSGEVLAWDVPRPVEERLIDWERYHELAVRAASAVFWPMGIPEDDLRAWLKGGIQLKFDFALPDGKRHFLLPPREEESAWKTIFQPKVKIPEGVPALV